LPSNDLFYEKESLYELYLR